MVNQSRGHNVSNKLKKFSSPPTPHASCLGFSCLYLCLFSSCWLPATCSFACLAASCLVTLDLRAWFGWSSWRTHLVLHLVSIQHCGGDITLEVQQFILLPMTMTFIVLLLKDRG